MPLITGEFQNIALLPSTDPAWAGLAFKPSLPATITEALISGATFTVYVIDSATGVLAFEGGQVSGILDSVLASVSAALPRQDFTDLGGNTTVWGNTGGAGVHVYSNATGVLQRYAATQVANLKAFLP